MNIPLTLIDFFALSPLLALLAGALCVILLETFFPNGAKKAALPLSLVFLGIAIFNVIDAPVSHHPLITPWLAFDNLSRFFSLFFLSAGILSVLLSASFFKRFNPPRGEFFFLLLSSIFGLLLIGGAADFLTLFIGLEILSIALYVLCGYIKHWGSSREAAAKYFLMGALATSFLLYGIAFIYGATGATHFEGLLTSYQNASNHSMHAYFLLGATFVTLGLAFKAAIVPFHTWAPDVYCGASTPVTAFMSVATKAGAFAAFIRIFMLALPNFHSLWNQSIAFLAIPTLIYANIVALQQVQLRRFFAYSGIAHAGFLMIPLAVGGNEALVSLLFYLVVYGLATFGSFAILAFLDNKEEGVTLDDVKGLFKRSPYLAIIFSIFLLTLTGLPPTIGFLAKFYIFKVAYSAHYYSLVIVGLLMSILAAFYYLRIVAMMFVKTPPLVDRPMHSTPAVIVTVICLIGVLILSIYPQPLLTILQNL